MLREGVLILYLTSILILTFKRSNSPPFFHNFFSYKKKFFALCPHPQIDVQTFFFLCLCPFMFCPVYFYVFVRLLCVCLRLYVISVFLAVFFLWVVSLPDQRMTNVCISPSLLVFLFSFSFPFFCYCIHIIKTQK